MVVGRSLDCSYSEGEARRLLEPDCLESAEADSAISTLTCARLSAQESRLLPWVRDTGHYQTSAIQNRTRALAALELAGEGAGVRAAADRGAFEDGGRGGARGEEEKHEHSDSL